MYSTIRDTMLLVGDGNSMRSFMRDVFKENYNILEAESIAQAAMIMEHNKDCIVMIILDVPKEEGKNIRTIMDITNSGSGIPVVVIVDTNDSEREAWTYLMGAVDVIVKPCSAVVLEHRIKVIIDLYIHKWNLEKMVKKQSETIRNSNQAMVDTLSAIIEYRNAESGNHVLRIRRFTKLLLDEIKNFCPEYGLTDTQIDIIASASALHDIGKISVVDAVLNKPGKLTEDEFEIIKTHTTIGARLVEQLAGMGEEEYLRYAYNIALYHHERWDGKGYPCGLKGDEIPICAQVVGLADVFDALITRRVYKPAYPYKVAINMILNGECGVFSPKLLECFKHVREKFIAFAQKYADGYSPKNDNISIPLPGPVWERNRMDTLHFFQSKYQTLMHYINSAIIEVDIDSGFYQLLYNPDVELDAVFSKAGTLKEDIERIKINSIHPDDVSMADEMIEFMGGSFIENSSFLKRAFSIRLFSPLIDEWQRYEIVFMRVDTGTTKQRVATVIWHKTDDSIVPEYKENSLHSSPALYGIVSSVIRCNIDERLTIDKGHADLFPVSGYSRQEIYEIFDDSFMNMVADADKGEVRSAIKHMIRSGVKNEVEFRIKTREKGYVWVLAKGRIYAENHEEKIYLAIRDNSNSHAINEKLEKDIERNQLLINQTGSIVFEWDLVTDTMYCSQKWDDHFGYSPVSENYGAQMGIATHFHPDDLPVVRGMIETVRKGATVTPFDVRIANSSGKYLWTKITATAVYNEDGNISKILGILQDIDELKRTTIILEEMTQKDSLTKLLNKESVNRLADDYLCELKDEMAALMVLDIDNFKSVNDTMGHLYGDVVLTNVANNLKKFFRGDDIVGRVGGDEFVVLLKGIPRREIVDERCGFLLDVMREMFLTLTPDLPVSCSVGATIVPEHGKTYRELFKKADEALYTAKKKGKNRYCIYESGYTFTPVSDEEVHTRIDSDDPSAVTNDSFERFVFKRLYESKDLYSTIDELLAFVGTNFNISRAYIFENNEDNTACSNTFEWCNEGILPEKENLQNVSYITDIPGWPEVYDENGILYCTDITELDAPFKAILEPQNIKSMLQCAIMDRGVFRGYVGFDECTYNRLWTKEQLRQLEFMAEVLSVFLIRERSYRK